MIMKFLSNAPIIFLSANTSQPVYSSTNGGAQFQPSIITISSKHEFSVNKYNASAASLSQSSAINNYNAFNEAASNTVNKIIIFSKNGKINFFKSYFFIIIYAILLSSSRNMP